MKDSLEELVKVYKGDEVQANRVYGLLKQDYINSTNQRSIMYLDEALDYIHGLNVYIQNNLTKYKNPSEQFRLKL